MISGGLSSAPPRRRVWSRPAAILLSTVAATTPACVILLVNVMHPLPHDAIAGCVAASVLWALAIGWALLRAVDRHLRTLASLVDSARAHDYTIRAVHAREEGSLGELYRQVNALIGDLDAQRSTEQELLGVLRRVVDQIDVAIVVFGASGQLRLVNPSGAKLLGVDASKLAALSYDETPFPRMDLGAEGRVVDYRFATAEGRWRISEQNYRQQGRPARIVFVADVQQVLADEEIRVWQRLIRVVSHEVNNSLAPIISLCQTLDGIIGRMPPQGETVSLRDGLSLIADRAEGLKSFISVYARVARLPEPRKAMFPVRQLVDRVAGMFATDGVLVEGDVPMVELFGDRVHLEQVLINLVRNAVQSTDAVSEGDAQPVMLRVAIRGERCEFEIVDAGTGIANSENLFVPFYSTRQDGSGIGLVLCRNILSQHGGTVSLSNRPDARGAIARVSLPLPG